MLRSDVKSTRFDCLFKMSIFFIILFFYNNISNNTCINILIDWCLMPPLAIFQLYLDMCINTVLLINLYIVSHIRGGGSHQLVLTLAIFLCLSQP